MERDVSGYRQSRYNILTEEEIILLNNHIDAIQADRNIFRFNEGTATGYSERTGHINVKGDVFPDFNSTQFIR
jgi:hypothetical protein